MKKLFALVSILALGVTLAACNAGEVDAKESTYLSVDINPSVEFIVDEDGEIESYTALNEDAEVVLADLDLEGMDYEEALDLYLDEATELGYIDVNADDNAVYISTDEDDEETEDTEEGDTEEDNEDSEGSLGERVKEKVNEHFKSRGILGAAVEKDLEEEYGDVAEEYDIGLGKARLISRAVELDEDLTFEEAVEMDMREIMSILREDHRERMREFRAERREQARDFKDSIKDEIREEVKAHRDEIEEKRENGEEVGPEDFDKIMERIKNRTEEDSPVRDRMETIKDRVRERMKGDNPFFSDDDDNTDDGDNTDDDDTEE
ncbi:MAG: hypothetical protein ACLFUQ_06520 [Candidatus Izemoplasmataceae bacterium]